MDSALQEGLVLRIDAKFCQVEIGGQRHSLPLSGKLFERKSHEKRPLSVGDRVLVRIDAQGGAIDELLPRMSQLTRRAASEGEERAQVIAANITLVLIVASIAEPPFQPELVDGLLAAARRENLNAVIVLTKLDRDKKGAVAHWQNLYQSIGVTVLVTSTSPELHTDDAFAQLAKLLHENRSVMCGLSGAGKSTLLNLVMPGLELRVGSLNHIRQGRHTTTHTELIPLPFGGHVLDTPGVRSFHMFHIGVQETQFLFVEIAALLPQCGYRNCLHLGEPDCAVRVALAEKTIAETRYASYTAMLNWAQAAAKHVDGDDDRSSRRRRPR
ncbi:MAG: ribosome small subunit-dependent GTPase A [Planctomycetota bacterium]|jgi:ribosome biogenesis GTPase